MKKKKVLNDGTIRIQVGIFKKNLISSTLRDKWFHDCDSSMLKPYNGHSILLKLNQSQIKNTPKINAGFLPIRAESILKITTHFQIYLLEMKNK